MFGGGEVAVWQLDDGVAGDGLLGEPAEPRFDVCSIAGVVVSAALHDGEAAVVEGDGGEEGGVVACGDEFDQGVDIRVAGDRRVAAEGVGERGLREVLDGGQDEEAIVGAAGGERGDPVQDHEFDDAIALDGEAPALALAVDVHGERYVEVVGRTGLGMRREDGVEGAVRCSEAGGPFSGRQGAILGDTTTGLAGVDDAVELRERRGIVGEEAFDDGVQFGVWCATVGGDGRRWGFGRTHARWRGDDGGRGLGGWGGRGGWGGLGVVGGAGEGEGEGSEERECGDGGEGAGEAGHVG